MDQIHTEQQVSMPLKSIQIGFGLAGIAVLAGAIVGWVGLLFFEGTKEIAEFAGIWYWSLAAILPIALTIWSYKESPKNAALNIGSLLLTSMIAWVIGTALYMVVVYVIPSTFGGEDPVALVNAVKTAILWKKAFIVGGIIFGSTFILALLLKGKKQYQ